MFRLHTSRYGSCASEIHKTMCYFFAGLNIFLALDLLAHIFRNEVDVLDDMEEYLDELELEDTFFIGGPAVANIILAVMLIIGLYKRRPALIRVFTLFIIAQMVAICILSVFVYTYVVQHEGKNTIMLLVLAVFTALLGAEAWIAGDYYKLLVDEIRFESFESTAIL